MGFAYDEQLADDLTWLADKAGFSFMALPASFEQGFDQIACRQSTRFYGVSTELQTEGLRQHLSYERALQRQLVSDDYPQEFFERMARVARDMRKRSEGEGFLFFNGETARLRDVGLDKSARSLDLQLEQTSYFSALGDMPIGYRHRRSALPPEPPLKDDLFWINDDWRRALPLSPLANPLNVQTVLYNDDELFYCLRGRVAFGQAVISGTSAGVVEPDRDNLDAPLHSRAMLKEIAEETGLQVEPDQVSWLALGARRSDCGILLLSATRIEQSRSELERSIATAADTQEIAKVFGFPYRDVLGNVDLLEQVLAEKLIGRWEPGGYVWNSIGPATFLLALAHLGGAEQLKTAIRRLRVRWDSKLAFAVSLAS